VAAAAKAAKPTKKAASATPEEAVAVLLHPELPGVTVRFEYVTKTVADHYLTKLPDWQRLESEKTTDEYVEDMDDDD
jgi:hypothetical protein